MKLWWPHSEAMIAFLMGYSDSGDPALLRLFYQVAEYTFRQVTAAFYCIFLYEISKGVEEKAGSHSSPGRPGPGFSWAVTGGWAGMGRLALTGRGPSADVRVPGGLAPVLSVQSTKWSLLPWSSCFGRRRL